MSVVGFSSTDTFLLPDSPPLPPYVDFYGCGGLDFSLDSFLSQPNYLLDLHEKEEPSFFNYSFHDNTNNFYSSSCCCCCGGSGGCSRTPYFCAANIEPNRKEDEEKKSEGGRVSAQSVAARERRRKIAEKTQELGRLVPGGSDMNTAHMLQHAFKYVKFLQTQVRILGLASSMEDERGVAELGDMLSSWSVQMKLFGEDKCVVPIKLVESIIVKEEDESGLIFKELDPTVREVDSTTLS